MKRMQLANLQSGDVYYIKEDGSRKRSAESGATPFPKAVFADGAPAHYFIVDDPNPNLPWLLIFPDGGSVQSLKAVARKYLSKKTGVAQFLSSGLSIAPEAAVDAMVQFLRGASPVSFRCGAGAVGGALGSMKAEAADYETKYTFILVRQRRSLLRPLLRHHGHL